MVPAPMNAILRGGVPLLSMYAISAKLEPRVRRGDGKGQTRRACCIDATLGALLTRGSTAPGRPYSLGEAAAAYPPVLVNLRQGVQRTADATLRRRAVPRQCAPDCVGRSRARAAIAPRSRGRNSQGVVAGRGIAHPRPFHVVRCAARQTSDRRTRAWGRQSGPWEAGSAWPA